MSAILAHWKCFYFYNLQWKAS